MVSKLEYDSLVRRLNPATVAVLALVLMVPVAQAQLNASPSVTSTGFGGSSGPRGISTSATSAGFGAPGRATPTPPSVTSWGFSRSNPGFTTHPATSRHEHHDGIRHPRTGAGYGVPYYYPYAYGAGESYSADDSTEDDEYQGGPTIFDRRGPGTTGLTQDGYVDEGLTQSSPAAQADEEAVSNQPDTVLIFKDGHQVEVSNYAIVGATLFDLSGSGRHKIPLSELNLTATIKENDDRGTDFRLPAGSQAN